MNNFSVDLNCDIGESFGAYNGLLEMDKLIMPYISSANIACGFHASDPVTIKKTVEEAVKNNLSIGAHPGLPDLLGFGRRNIKISLEEAESYIIYQIGALDAFAKCYGTGIHHVKPHGALYNMAADDEKLAIALCNGIKKCNESLILVALYGSCLVEAAKKTGIPYVCEVFADRAYLDNGRLVPRFVNGSVIENEDEVVKRTIKMIKNGTVKTITGNEIPVVANTVCVHGDNPKALEFLKKINKEFQQKDIVVKKF